MSKRKPSVEQPLSKLKLPAVKPGEWRGEVFGPCQLSFGQILQPAPYGQSVEFTYLIVPAFYKRTGDSYEWHGAIMIGPPTPMKTEFPEAGFVYVNPYLGSLTLNLHVERQQFSDMLPLFMCKKFKDLHFTIADPIGDDIRISSWGMGLEL
ncbi:hypothetical protein [Rhizobium sp. L245/93]|uniref:hypothetical protein n=1 Tax=Rhizobium sp. L245/93 TaxID=2819998 RepID=UPI001ADD1A15|nr:hypothetical protein [Rhizobium sp. L245/93]MBO9168355.1 hypothetical protein [Rhizobium sp. L245/93]